MDSSQLEVFSVSDWQARDRPRPCAMVRPRQVTCWTKTSDTQGGEFLYGSAQGLGHYCAPPLPADLNQGFPDSFVRKAMDKGSPVEQVVQSILHTAQGLALLQGIQVLTYRNNLNKIFGTLFSPKDEWVVDGCMHQDTLFLDIVKTGEASFPNSDLMTFYGYKFETICTRGPDPLSAPVDSTSEYCSVVTSQIDGITIVLAAEVDLLDEQLAAATAPSENGLPPSNAYLELKTLKAPQNPGQWRTLVNFKWPKWWLQSFLAGVETLVLGSRDDQGTLTQVERLPVQTLPATARQRGGQWDAWQALRLGADMLCWMRARTARLPAQHCRFTYTPGQGGRPGLVRCQVVEDGLLPARLAQTLPE